MKYYLVNELTAKILTKGGRAINISALHEKNCFEAMSFKTQPEATLWLMKGRNKSLNGYYPMDEATVVDKFSINFGTPKPEQKSQVAVQTTEELGLDRSANIDETVNTAFINETLELLEHLAAMKVKLAQVLAKAPADIRRVDSAITDALHLTEFRQLSTEEAVNLVNKVHDNRVERRRLKNEAAVAQNAATLLNNVSIEELMRSIYFIRNMGTRKYTPRTGDFFETTEQRKAEG